MRILIKNIPNTYNYGAMMMAENIITYFNQKLNNDVEYYTEAFTPSDLERLKEATKYNKIYKDSQFDLKLITQNIKYVRYIERQIKKKFIIKKACHFYDVIIILGGDDYAETYYKLPKDNIQIKQLFKELQFFNNHTKLYMIGQTIGPYTGKRIKMGKKGFKNIKIYARDEITVKYMKDTFDIDVKSTRDLAFLNLNLEEEYQKNKDKILKEYNLKENEYITVVGTDLFKKYVANEEDFITGIYNTIKRIKKEMPEKKIVCLTHVINRNSIGDTLLYKKINEKYNNYLDKECIMITEPILPIKARILLGYGYLTITCRMHPAVSTFHMGKPAISISYSKKYKGVIAEGLKCPELVIDSKQKDLWPNNIENTVFEKIEYIKQNYEELTKKIQKEVKNCQKIVQKTLDEITKEIK